jgi:DNA-binding NtrC family response regulator
MPPLRERREDIPALASHFLDQANREAAKRLRGISPAALHRLVHYAWPGNIRELKHVIQRAVVLSESSVLQATDIGSALIYRIKN